MCGNGKNKGDKDMVMIQEKTKKKINRQELREKLIRETIKENRTTLKRLSQT